MNMQELVRKARSCRRFFEDHAIETDTLRNLVDLARLSASAANLQPLKYVIAHQKEKNALIFNHLGWAAYLKDWPGPPPGERPSAYIIILGDRTISKNFGCDHGIAGQSILLGANDLGLAACMIGAINRERLRQDLAIPEHLEILLVIALGKPKEKIKLEAVGPDGDIKYWRDAEGIHHVPKRSLDEIILSL